jgi:hypothetical protein
METAPHLSSDSTTTSIQPEAHDSASGANQPKYQSSQGNPPMASSISPIKTFYLAFFVVIVGIASGFGLNKITASQSSQIAGMDQDSATAINLTKENLKVGETYGSSKSDRFPDDAEGVLIHGGIEGEGTHRLLRAGGVSQTVCLTSSVLDLDLFVDHKIKVSGETFDTQKCQWFMDVGQVEILELDAEKPFEVEEESLLTE